VNNIANGCVAVTIAVAEVSSFQNYCFQFKSGYGEGEVGADENWTTVVLGQVETTTKTPAGSWIPDGNVKILFGTRLTEPYVTTFPITDVFACYQLCLNDFFNGCVGVALTQTEGISVGHCLQFKAGYGNESDTEWTSITRSVGPLMNQALVRYDMKLTGNLLGGTSVNTADSCFNMCVDLYNSGLGCVVVTYNSLTDTDNCHFAGDIYHYDYSLMANSRGYVTITLIPG
jgi:hypothetical protein